jgi:GNAT superfamily N-acetyltransferase
VRSLKSARRGDDLGRRLHAAESALALVRALFGLESTWPPYHDELEAALPALEAAQDWPAGYVSSALLRLLTDGDVPFQQELQDRVERLMTSRGIEHEWGSDLEPLKALRVPALAFRRARSDEAGAMRELIIRSMGHVDRPSGYLAEARELMSLSGGDLERDEAWVILADGTVAGFYRLSRTDASAAEIEEFHLEPPMIGIGIGRRMFEHALDRAREMGAGRLEWTTDAHALGFYLRMGGEIAGTEPSGIEGEEPLTAMRIDLTGPSRPT